MPLPEITPYVSRCPTDIASRHTSIRNGKTSPSSQEHSKSAWEIALMKARWGIFRQEVLRIWIPTCTTTRWRLGKWSCKFTECPLYNSTTSILTTTQATRSRQPAQASQPWIDAGKREAPLRWCCCQIAQAYFQVDISLKSRVALKSTSEKSSHSDPRALADFVLLIDSR